MHHTRLSQNNSIHKRSVAAHDGEARRRSPRVQESSKTDGGRGCADGSTLAMLITAEL
ncbi:unnamed protein product [Brassica napus]|uniref:(rape) hypothetical protein n=1 Tax=Brassica napus TaxID=3708 RepID=A0A816SPP5_BRANA|nr:unnamed protein product [Brassica napus]